MLRDELREELSLHGAGLRELIRTYAAHQQERVSLVASRTRLRQLLHARLDGEVEAEPFLTQTRRILLDARKSTDGFLDIRIASPAGRIVTATDEASLGTDVSAEPAYREGRSEAVLGTPRSTDSGSPRAPQRARPYQRGAASWAWSSSSWTPTPLLGLRRGHPQRPRDDGSAAGHPARGSVSDTSFPS